VRRTPVAPVRWTGPLYGVEVGKTRTRWPVRTYSRLVPGASGRVLVVDDNKVIRQLIRVNLELEGLEVVTAADGAECLDVVHQVRPDVVTLDVVMPRLDGLRTAARLRADPRTHHLPLAIISACTQYEVDTGLDVGVDAFLAKPFEPAELVRLVKRLIERAGDGDGGEGGQGGGGHRGGGGSGGGDGDGDGDGDGGPDGGGGNGRVLRSLADGDSDGLAGGMSHGISDGIDDGVSDGVPGGISSGG
jgi:CheY-like chemotaxis protein